MAEAPLRAFEQCDYQGPRASLEQPVALGGQRMLQRGQIMVNADRLTGFLFADCGAGRAVVVGETSRYRGTARDPYRVGAKTDIDKLIGLARQRAEIFDILDANSNMSGSPYDPFCGCALHYKGSAGAKLSRTK